MASFKPYYTLCPLVSSKALIGLSPDQEDDCILVTLGGNIAVRHKLSDQKPLQSWSTRQSNQFTSPVVYDVKKEQYLSIFNHKHISLWNSEDSNLDHLKKYAFTTGLHSILTRKDDISLVVYSTGFCEPLDTALASRKEEKPQILVAGERVQHSFFEELHGQKVLILFVGTQKDEPRVYCLKLDNNGQPESHLSCTLKNGNSKVTGRTVAKTENGLEVVVSWNDGLLARYSLLDNTKLLASSRVSQIKLSQPVCLQAINSTHILVYGADPNDEGAVLMFWDLKFSLSPAMRKLKVFSHSPQLWATHRGTNGWAFVPVGQNLTVAPYRLQPSLLASLVGKHANEVQDQPGNGCWGTQQGPVHPVPPLEGTPNPLKKRFCALLQSGLSHAMVADTIFPIMLEKKDLDAMLYVLRYLKDISEEYLVRMLELVLPLDDSHFSDLELSCHIPATFSAAKSGFINHVLALSFNEIFLLQALHKMSTTNAVKLLEFLAVALDNASLQPLSAPTLENLLDWTALLLDAQHNQLLLIQDPALKSMLKDMQELLIRKSQFLNAFTGLEPLLNAVIRKKRIHEPLRNRSYTIEHMRLY